MSYLACRLISVRYRCVPLSLYIQLPQFDSVNFVLFCFCFIVYQFAQCTKQISKRKQFEQIAALVFAIDYARSVFLSVDVPFNQAKQVSKNFCLSKMVFIGVKYCNVHAKHTRIKHEHYTLTHSQADISRLMSNTTLYTKTHAHAYTKNKDDLIAAPEAIDEKFEKKNYF